MAVGPACGPEGHRSLAGSGLGEEQRNRRRPGAARLRDHPRWRPRLPVATSRFRWRRLDDRQGRSPKLRRRVERRPARGPARKAAPALPDLQTAAPPWASESAWSRPPAPGPQLPPGRSEPVAAPPGRSRGGLEPRLRPPRPDRRGSLTEPGSQAVGRLRAEAARAAPSTGVRLPVGEIAAAPAVPRAAALAEPTHMPVRAVSRSPAPARRTAARGARDR